MRKPDLTSEQIALGQLYLWIHQRAEYLRAKAANAQGSEANRQDVEPSTRETQASEAGFSGGVIR